MVMSTSEKHSTASNAAAATTLGEVDGCYVDTLLERFMAVPVTIVHNTHVPGEFIQLNCSTGHT